MLLPLHHLLKIQKEGETQKYWQDDALSWDPNFSKDQEELNEYIFSIHNNTWKYSWFVVLKNLKICFHRKPDGVFGLG